MNNDINRNTRTLIVSFVVAIMVLIPLRFVEVGNGVVSEAAVLGEAVVESEPKIELPYAEIEATACVPKIDIDKAVSKLTMSLKGKADPKELREVAAAIDSLRAIECK